MATIFDCWGSRKSPFWLLGLVLLQICYSDSLNNPLSRYRLEIVEIASYCAYFQAVICQQNRYFAHFQIVIVKEINM